MEDKAVSLINVFSKSFENNIISKFIISKVNKKSSEKYEFFSFAILPYNSKTGKILSVVYKFSTKEIRENISFEAAIDLIKLHLGASFLQGDLFLKEEEYHLLISAKGKASLIHKKSTQIHELDYTHNRVKNHILGYEPLPFLKELGVFTTDGKLKEDKREKFKQLNKYLEFFKQGLKEANLTQNISVVDMGSGKGYLTFAMYYFLSEIMKVNANVNGVELRQDMVDLCNSISKKVDFKGLVFKKDSIQEYPLLQKTDVLVALHACDTATDDALAKGISAKVPLIIVAPCCHKQVRKAMLSKDDLAVFEKFGIIKERFAETITDLIRSLILEAYGYETKIFEFIGAENTPKNMMITAVLRKYTKASFSRKMIEVQGLKNRVGLSEHYLERVLG